VDDRVPNKQKLVELPYALVSYRDFDELANLIMDFDYIEAKCVAGGDYTTSLMEDYIFTKDKLKGTDKGREVSSFFRFITTWFHVLKRNPSCLTSLALNYVPDNPVTTRMEQKWDQKLGVEEGGWIKWINTPTAIDPCIFTNVVSRAECIAAIRCSPDGSISVVAGNRFCGVYDFRTYNLHGDFRGHTEWIRGVCFSPDGRYVLTVSNDKTGKVWNALSAELCSTLSGHLSWVTGCDWSPDDRMVLTVSEDCSARLWNPYLGYAVGINEHHWAGIKCGKFSPSAEEAITGDAEGNLFKWSTDTCKVLAKKKLDRGITCVQWSKASGAIAAATYSGLVVLLTSDLEAVRSLEGIQSFIPQFSC